MIECIKNPGKSIYDTYVDGDQNVSAGRMPDVGSIKKYSDGREFVLVSTAVNVAAGQVLSSAAAAAELAGKFTAALAGDTEIVVEKASVTANQYADGYLVVTESSGTKTTYAIKSNTASSSANKVTLTLYSPITSAIAAADDCILVPSRYSSVVIGTAASDGIGVAMAASTAATSGKTNYIWAQTKGIGGAKTGTASTLVAGVKMVLGAAGVVESQGTAGIQREVGHVLDITAAVSNGDLVPAFLNFG